MRVMHGPMQLSAPRRRHAPQPPQSAAGMNAPVAEPRGPRGDSPSEAVEAATPCEQADWLRKNLYQGWVVEMQELVSIDGRPFDVVHLRWPDGSSSSIYFDVTGSVGRLGSRPASGLQISADGGTLTVTQGSQCTLPSADSACRLMAGDLSAAPDAALHTLGRSALIAVGVYAAGERDLGKLARYSVGAALAIEAFALAWAYSRQRRR